MKFKVRCKAKGKRQKAKGKRQKAKGKRQRAKGKRQKAKGKRQKAKGKRQKAKRHLIPYLLFVGDGTTLIKSHNVHAVFAYVQADRGVQGLAHDRFLSLRTICATRKFAAGHPMRLDPLIPSSLI